MLYVDEITTKVKTFERNLLLKRTKELELTQLLVGDKGSSFRLFLASDFTMAFTKPTLLNITASLRDRIGSC